MRSVVLVEGMSDRLAVETLAARRGRDLEAEGVRVVAMGGSKNIARLAAHYGPPGMGLRLAGMYDAAEEADFRHGLERAGLGSDLNRAAMERLGFFVCVADLEDELIRAAGVEAVEAVVDAAGELGSFRVFQRQPQWQGRPPAEQLRRFLGTQGGRKVRSARALAAAVDLGRVPAALDGVLASA